MVIRQVRFLFLLIVLMVASNLLLFLENCIGYNDHPNKNLSNKEYVDPKGFFKISPPVEWHIQEYLDDPRGKVAFWGPDVDFRILAQVVEVSSFEELVEKTKIQAEELRRILGAITKVEKISLGGGSAVKVSVEMHRNGDKEKYIFINFLRGNILHNFTYGGPINKYSEYLPIVKLSMETYEPTASDISEKDIIKHAVAAKTRRAELDMEMGDLLNALRIVNEGLDIDPMNPKLIDLKMKIIELRKKK